MVQLPTGLATPRLGYVYEGFPGHQRVRLVRRNAYSVGRAHRPSSGGIKRGLVVSDRLAGGSVVSKLSLSIEYRSPLSSDQPTKQRGAGVSHGVVASNVEHGLTYKSMTNLNLQGGTFWQGYAIGPIWRD